MSREDEQERSQHDDPEEVTDPVLGDSAQERARRKQPEKRHQPNEEEREPRRHCSGGEQEDDRVTQRCEVRVEAPRASKQCGETGIGKGWQPGRNNGQYGRQVGPADEQFGSERCNEQPR